MVPGACQEWSQSTEAGVTSEHYGVLPKYKNKINKQTNKNLFYLILKQFPAAKRGVKINQVGAIFENITSQKKSNDISSLLRY